MMLEQAIRPFQDSNALSRRRISTVVASGGSPAADPGEAALSWTMAGEIPTGTPVPPSDNLVGPGINIECCDDLYDQTLGMPYEDIKVTDKNDPDGYIVVRRPKRIGFTKKDNWCSKSKSGSSRITVAPVPGMFTDAGRQVFNASYTNTQKPCQSTYNLRYDNPSRGPAPAQVTATPGL